MGRKLSIKQFILAPLAVAFLIMLASVANAQQRQVSGTVTNEAGDALKGVNLRFKGGVNIIAQTDENGKFVISADDKKNPVLVFSAEGYDEKEVNFKDKTVLNVVLIASLRKNQYGKVVKHRVKLETESRDGILVMESEDKDFKTWYDTRVYLDGAHFFDKNTYNPIGDGITIRRARFAVKTKMWKNWYGELDLDFANAELELKDAYIKYTSDNGRLNIKAGHFKEGFSMETTTTSRYLTFIERSLVSKMSPSRHLGFNATYWGKHYTAISGIHFQSVGELEEVEYSKDKNKKEGIDEGYSLTERLAIRPVYNDDMVLHIGGGFSYRTPKTSWEYENTYRYSTRTITSINRKKYIDTDDLPGVNHIELYGGELAGAWRNFMFQSEYISTKIYREGLPSITLEGAYAQVAMLVFGGKYVYNPSEAEFTQLDRGKSWGDLEVAFRFDYVNANDFNAKVYGGGANAYTLGLNYYFNSNVKIMLDYTFANHDRYANGKGKLYVGHDADGNLTKNFEDVVEPAGQGGEDFGFIQARIEIDF